MRSVLFLAFFVYCIYINSAYDLVVGSRVNNLLISTEKVLYNGIPLIKRDKDYKYMDSKQRIIKSYQARSVK
ncbi:unnamed protein product [Leptidea sinapis]|uniref:Uncharacterized protein n=1 Tax=Leptidea sinapis TaxID=189913 RepID=A0A5E4QR12_9NEOP|nr:unnamed protein product [Leptidea sinapis]